MIEPVSVSLHQDIAFLVKSDMAEHQIMQSIMRQVGREFANADLVAANLAARSVHKPETEIHAGRVSVVDSIEAIAQTHQLNYPMVLKRGIEKFGFRNHDLQYVQSKENGADSQDNESIHEEQDLKIDAADIAVFRAVDQMMPALQDESLCAGMQIGLYHSPEVMSSFWRNNLIVVLLPIDGQLGERESVFVLLLKHGFEPKCIQGRLLKQSGNPIQPLPSQEIFSQSASDLVVKSVLQLEKNTMIGKSFLLGLINQIPSSPHWFDLDQRDMD